MILYCNCATNAEEQQLLQLQHHTYKKKLGQVTSHKSEQDTAIRGHISTEAVGQSSKLTSQTELLIKSDVINVAVEQQQNRAEETACVKTITSRDSRAANESLAVKKESQAIRKAQETSVSEAAEQPIRTLIERKPGQLGVSIPPEVASIIAIESVEKPIRDETHRCDPGEEIKPQSAPTVSNTTQIGHLTVAAPHTVSIAVDRVSPSNTVATETIRPAVGAPNVAALASEHITKTIDTSKAEGVLGSDTRKSLDDSIQATGIVVEPRILPATNTVRNNSVVDTDLNSKSTSSPAAAITITTSFDDTAHSTLAPTATNPLPALRMQANDNNINALNMITAHIPSDTDSNPNNNDNKRSSNPPASGWNVSQPTNQFTGQGYQIVSLFHFGDRPGAPGQPPRPNLPDFLVPAQLIKYETSIEINLRKIPPPQPPPPPRFFKKMLVHTESLERRTRAFLSGNFEAGTTDSSLRTARQKIRSLKSTILKSDDEVKHAEDTIHKAQSGDFLKIFAPPIVEQPLYEFIEIPPSHRGDEECADVLDRHRDRSQSVQKQQNLDNMEDYYSSKYSSRTSRHRVEGECLVARLT